jgi:hypothetical protein
VADVYNQIQSSGDTGYIPGHFTSRYYNKCHNYKKYPGLPDWRLGIGLPNLSNRNASDWIKNPVNISLMVLRANGSMRENHWKDRHNQQNLQYVR